MGDETTDRPRPDVPPPPPRQPDERLKGYIERRNQPPPHSEDHDAGSASSE